MKASKLALVRAVPSTVLSTIRALFPDVDTAAVEGIPHELRRASAVRAVLDLLDQVPSELIQLPPADFARFCANRSVLQSAWEDRTASVDQLRANTLPQASRPPLAEIAR